MRSRPIKLVALVSGSGTTLQNLIDRIAGGQLQAKIALVIGSRPGLLGLERAQKARLPATVVDRREYGSCADFSRIVFQRCAEAEADLICLAGWLCLLDVPAEFHQKTMNIHPALLPSFGGPGMYGRHVHEAVLAHGCKISGCTVHFVDGSYDTGPIIVQRACPVLEDDTPMTLAQRVFEEEKIAYPQAIELFQQDRLRIAGCRVRVLPEGGD